jgi:flagellar biosynthesis protein
MKEKKIQTSTPIRGSEIKKAVALKYKETEDNAPKVIAKGKGYIAQKIIEMAKTHNIPIVEDPFLVESLIRIDLYKEIPPELYEAVAKIVAFIISVEKEKV